VADVGAERADLEAARTFGNSDAPNPAGSFDAQDARLLHHAGILAACPGGALCPFSGTDDFRHRLLPGLAAPLHSGPRLN
jgi:hypothetical protein